MSKKILYWFSDETIQSQYMHLQILNKNLLLIMDKDLNNPSTSSCLWCAYYFECKRRIFFSNWLGDLNFYDEAIETNLFIVHFCKFPIPCLTPGKIILNETYNDDATSTKTDWNEIASKTILQLPLSPTPPNNCTNSIKMQHIKIFYNYLFDFWMQRQNRNTKTKYF